MGSTTRGAGGKFVKAGEPSTSEGTPAQVGDAVSFRFTDPISLELHDGRGVVIAVADGVLEVAPLAPFTVSVPVDQVG